MLYIDNFLKCLLFTNKNFEPIIERWGGHKVFVVLYMSFISFSCLLNFTFLMKAHSIRITYLHVLNDLAQHLHIFLITIQGLDTSIFL